jgi:hypothetical protein
MRGREPGQATVRIIDLTDSLVLESNLSVRSITARCGPLVEGDTKGSVHGARVHFTIPKEYDLLADGMAYL